MLFPEVYDRSRVIILRVSTEDEMVEVLSRSGVKALAPELDRCSDGACTKTAGQPVSRPIDGAIPAVTL